MSRLAIAEQFYSPTVNPEERVQTLMSVTCDDCGESFSNKKALAGHARGECNPDGREKRTCKVCDDNFKAYPSHKKQTCSKECADEARRSALDGRNTGSGKSVELSCENCGEQFVRWKSQVESYDHHFCSKECHTDWRQDSNANYTAGSGTRSHPDLSHDVRSGWEEGFALMLVEAGIEYEYEPEKYDLGNTKYVPDFKVGDVIIEVKGRLSDSPKKLQKLGEQKEFTTVAIGAEIPADYRFPYENKILALEVLR